jgi:hypothetical protein
MAAVSPPARVANVSSAGRSMRWAASARRPRARASATRRASPAPTRSCGAVSTRPTATRWPTPSTAPSPSSRRSARSCAPAPISQAGRTRPPPGAARWSRPGWGRGPPASCASPCPSGPGSSPTSRSRSAARASTSPTWPSARRPTTARADRPGSRTDGAPTNG